jgi:hypothetical protein
MCADSTEHMQQWNQINYKLYFLCAVQHRWISCKRLQRGTIWNSESLVMLLSAILSDKRLTSLTERWNMLYY